MRVIKLWQRGRLTKGRIPPSGPMLTITMFCCSINEKDIVRFWILTSFILAFELKDEVRNFFEDNSSNRCTSKTPSERSVVKSDIFISLSFKKWLHHARNVYSKRRQGLIIARRLQSESGILSCTLICLRIQSGSRCRKEPEGTALVSRRLIAEGFCPTKTEGTSQQLTSYFIFLGAPNWPVIYQTPFWLPWGYCKPLPNILFWALLPSKFKDLGRVSVVNYTQ